MGDEAKTVVEVETGELVGEVAAGDLESRFGRFNWSPDDGLVAYVYGEPGGEGSEIRVADPSGAVEQVWPISSSLLTFRGASPWAPDGSRLLADRTQEGGAVLQVLEVATGRAQPIAERPARDEGQWFLHTMWMPDSESLVVEAGLSVDGSFEELEVFVVPLDGADPQQIATGLRHVSASPDGEHFALTDQGAYPENLYIYDRGGNELTHIAGHFIGWGGGTGR
jgi:Tol biopolymer transport system component